MPAPKNLEQFLTVNDPAKRWVRDKLIHLFLYESAVPSFPAAAIKLTTMARSDDVGMEDIAAVISKDPGLTTRCIRVATSPAYGGRTITTIDEALMMIGMKEIRRIAYSVGVMDRFNHLRVKVDWNRFWLHSLLVARICERTASAFHQSTGMEYLSGLLHDAGKLVIENYFPREFEQVLLRSWERNCGHAEIEREILGLDHTQIGAAMCECLGINHYVRDAVRYHHSADDPHLLNDKEGDQGFLASCVAVSDVLAHKAKETLGGEKQTDLPYDQLPEWGLLARFDPVHGLELDTDVELASAEEDLKSFGAK
ncbi:MAG: HDOD domain-containing protein [Verrucomicrobia bacterium]|nr:HDOD domain-containing protein [Verrucomicrobiota bacterium]